MNIFTGDVFAVGFIHHGLDFTTTVEKTQTMVEIRRKSRFWETNGTQGRGGRPKYWLLG